MPDDVVENRLMIEVHYYDPYNFTLNADSNITQWGDLAEDPDLMESWANEGWADSQFEGMKIHFYDQGIGMILGEYGAISRPDVPGHEAYRVYWNQYITEAAVANKLVPFYWDNGFTGDGGMGLFNRNTAAQVYSEIIQVITGADD